MCMWCPQKPEERIRSPRTGVTGVYEPLMWMLEGEPVSSVDQSVLLTVESSLQIQLKYLKSIRYNLLKSLFGLSNFTKLFLKIFSSPNFVRRVIFHSIYISSFPFNEEKPENCLTIPLTFLLNLN